MYFAPLPKHMIRLSVDYQQDSTIPIRLCKSLVEDTPSIWKHVCKFWTDSVIEIQKSSLNYPGLIRFSLNCMQMSFK